MTKDPSTGDLLSDGARRFLESLHRRFDATRLELLARRQQRQLRFDAGDLPEFLPETAGIREADWTIAPLPQDLLDRRVEITGPTDRKMVINALNSGASCFMADFEDANSPTWSNMLEGQANLRDAVRRTVRLETDDKTYELNESPAVLLVRPRGLHLDEDHFEVDGQPLAGGFFDFGLYFFHNAHALLERGTGPYFYLPKLESHHEARLWNEVFAFAEDSLEVPDGSIKATVLIETLPAAFEMDEILFELRDHSAGLNAGRWDYIFSTIKRLRAHPEFVLPDRSQVTMNVPFMRAYAELLVKTCHRRRAPAMGGMAAFIPSRRDEDVNRRAFAAVTADKEREAEQGFDGTWVAHPDLVPIARAVFDARLEGPNQISRTRDDVEVSADELLAVGLTEGAVTEAGLRTNISVAILYIESWLRGTGAAALFNLMEDAATAEISRSQVWQWVRHAARLDDGRTVTRDLVVELIDEELNAIEAHHGPDSFADGRFSEARKVFEQVALSEHFEEFLTIPSYELIK